MSVHIIRSINRRSITCGMSHVHCRRHLENLRKYVCISSNNDVSFQTWIWPSRRSEVILYSYNAEIIVSVLRPLFSVDTTGLSKSLWCPGVELYPIRLESLSTSHDSKEKGFAKI